MLEELSTTHENTWSKREGATEGVVKAAYRAMSRIYHPDKHNSAFTGKSDEEAVEFFHHLNNAHSVISQAATLSSKKRKRVISTMAPSRKKSNEGAVAKSKRPTMRKTNQFVTLLGKKTGKHVRGGCQCKDCEGKYNGGNPRSIWVCSACTRDGGVDPKQWWICGLEKRPECWLKNCCDMHSF